MTRTILKCMAIATLVTSVGCIKRSTNTLNHVDDPSTRGGDEALPWHFHTGQGFVVDEITDTASGKTTVVRSKCDLSEAGSADSGCKEKVYFFTRSEIDTFITAAKDVHEAHLKAHGGALAAASTIAIVSGKAAVAGLAAPDATVTKVVAIGSGVVAGIAAIVVVWEGWEMAKIVKQMTKIDQLMTEETAFVKRCGHLRKDFLERSQALGVTIIFAKNGGDYINGQEYLNALKIEDDLYDRTLAYAKKNRITSRQAYKEFFIEQCGQLPMTNLSRSDKLFAADWAYVPENIKQDTISTSKAIDLKSGELIQYTHFDGNDLDSQAEQDSMTNFLAQIRSDIKKIETSGNAQEKKNLDWFRTNYHQIIIAPRWSTWDMFASEYTTYEASKSEDKNYLYLNAIWSFSSGKYLVDHRVFFSEVLGIRAETLK